MIHNGFVQTAYIALGSNMGDRASLIAQAVAAVGGLSGVEAVRCSRLFETPAVGLDGVGQKAGQGAYLNAAAAVETSLGPRELLDGLLSVESALGRVERGRREKWAARPIDLDLLLWGDAVIDEPGLTVPHPQLSKRWFVLSPLCDVGADVIHPVFNVTIRELLGGVEEQGDESAGFGAVFVEGE